jgi:hypothetical protein
MTDPKETFLQKAEIVKSELQTIADSINSTGQTFGPASSQNILAAWQAEGVLTSDNAAELQSGLSTLPSAPSAINFQAIIDMITSLEEILEQDSGSGTSLSEVAVMPASKTAPGSPGQFYVEGVAAFWLCVAENRWVRLIQG